VEENEKVIASRTAIVRSRRRTTGTQQKILSRIWIKVLMFVVLPMHPSECFYFVPVLQRPHQWISRIQLSTTKRRRLLFSKQPKIWRPDYVNRRLTAVHGDDDEDDSVAEKFQLTCIDASTNDYEYQDPSSWLRIGHSKSQSGPDNDTIFRYSDLSKAVALETWRWCKHFVVAQNLCPWAVASVATTGAIRMYIVTVEEDHDNYETFQEVIDLVASEFQLELLVGNQNSDSTKLDPNTAIVFCVMVTTKTKTGSDAAHNRWDFEGFYEWFTGMEDLWLDIAEEEKEQGHRHHRMPHPAVHLTVAPFHPDWRFSEEGDDDPLAIEKQSPYPTVSIVATSVINKAGSAATEQIAKTNELTLQEKSFSEWKEVYERAIRPPT